MKNLIKLCFVLMASFIISSCDEGGTDLVEITVEADKTFILADGVEAITFTVTTKEGLDVTSDCVFKVNSEAISTNVHQSTEAGDNQCIAEYQSVVSNKLKFTVKELPIFVKNILVENYTAVWCGYCPRIHDAIVDALGRSENVIPMAIHGTPDPYYFTSIGNLEGVFQVRGYPTAIIDRSYSWLYPEEYAGLGEALNHNAALGLGITSEISGDNIVANVKVKFGKTFSSNLKIIVALVESKLNYDQANYYDDGRGNPIPNYEHNNVLRKFETNLFGDQIPEESTAKDSEYIIKYTFSASTYVKENCKVIAFVVNPDKEVLNVQDVIVPGIQDYQLLSK